MLDESIPSNWPRPLMKIWQKLDQVFLQSFQNLDCVYLHNLCLALNFTWNTPNKQGSMPQFDNFFPRTVNLSTVDSNPSLPQGINSPHNFSKQYLLLPGQQIVPAPPRYGLDCYHLLALSSICCLQHPQRSSKLQVYSDFKNLFYFDQSHHSENKIHLQWHPWCWSSKGFY